MVALKQYLLCTLLIGSCSLCWTCHTSGPSVVSIAAESTYDSVLAKELGADEYGMKQYVMALLRAGPNRSLDSLASSKLQSAHLENIGRLAKEGKLVLAGPFIHDGPLRGIYVFDVTTLEEAEDLTKTDPAIKAGSLEMELVPWYGSAALLKVNEIHAKIASKGLP